jgi:hypothetical protein
VSAPTTPTVPAARITAISPDRELAQRLATALAAVGAVDIHATLDARAAGDRSSALWVVQIGDGAGTLDALVPRLPGESPVIAVVPRADVAALVEVMRGSERVVGAVAADVFDPHQLAAMAMRIVGDDVLGLDKVMRPGTEIHTRAVADHADKEGCMAQLSERIERLGVPRRYRDPIEQCVDEMVMNALYDAPVDGQGRQLFAGTSVKARVALRSDHSVVVQYAHDGGRFAVSVRDAFGALERRTVLAALHKCLHAGRPVESRAGGAGLGLYLMLNSSTAVQFCVLPGIATEVICVFDLGAPRLALAELGFLVQIDTVGQRATGPARLRRARRRPSRLIAGAAFALAAVLGIAVVLRGSADRVATVELDSQPPGAAVEIDGTPIGTTPAIVTSLEPDTALTIVFRRTGYRAASVRFRVPAPGGSDRLVQPLERSDELARVRFVSKPPGAEITRTGRPPGTDRTYTPAELFVDAGQIQRFTLTMPGHVPLVIDPFTPARGARDLEKGGELVEGATLRIEATLVGRVTVSGAPHCHDVALPADCALAPGSYAIEYRSPDGSRVDRRVTMTGRDSTERLALGVVAAAPGTVLLPGGSTRAVFEVGTRTVTVRGPRGSHPAVVTVEPGATVIAE